MWHFAYTPGRAFCKMARLGISVTWRLISSSTRTVKSSRISLCPQFTFLVAVHPLLVNCSLLLAAFYFPVVDGTHNMLSKTSHPCPVVLPQWLKLLFYTHQFSFVNTPAASLGVEQQWPPPFCPYCTQFEGLKLCLEAHRSEWGCAFKCVLCTGLFFLSNSLLLDPSLDLIRWHLCNVGKIRCVR